MMNKIALYGSGLRIKELFKFFKQYAPFPTVLNPDPKSLQNTYVFTNLYRRDLTNLQNTNKLILLQKENKLANKIWLLLPSVDYIITDTYEQGLHISAQLISKGFNKRIINLYPWSIPKNLNDNHIFYDGEKKFENILQDRKIQRNDPKAPIRILMTKNTDVHEIVEGMLSGAVILAPDCHPYNNLIIDEYNGFLIRTPSDIIKAFKKIDKNKEWISYRAKTVMETKLNPTKYLNSLLYPEQLESIKLEQIKVESKDRRWLVRERIFQNGKLKYYPEIYGPNFNVIDLTEIQEILSYFLTQQFSEVYIFGCDIPKELNKKDAAQLTKMLNKIGSRSMKIHFCRDESIPQSWQKIFSKLSVISIEEGSKQVLS